MESLVASRAHRKIIHNLREMQQSLFPVANSAKLQLLCEGLVAPLRGWWKSEEPSTSLQAFRFLVKCMISQRLNKLGIHKRRSDITNRILEGLRSLDHSMCYYSDLHEMLVAYKPKYARQEDAMSQLELALWKQTFIGEDSEVAPAAAVKEQCRINCGADVIILNVLPYLIHLELF